MIETLALTALALALPATTRDAPDRLITQHGVELLADEQVFVLFAALNAAGYAEETERKGPPLRAPVFHAIREEVRDALRKTKDQSAMGELRRLFEENPGELEDYLAAALAADDKAKISKEAAKLRGKLLPVLERLKEEAQLAALFDQLAVAQREHARKLKDQVEKDFAQAAKILGEEELRAPAALVVVPNPLDAHGSVRLVEQGDRRVLVVGPGAESARRTILLESLRPTLAETVKTAWPSAKGFAKSWDGLKISKRITSRWPTGEAYLAESLTHAVAFRVRSADGKGSKEAEEEFIDEQAKDGLRWARAALRVLELPAAGARLSGEIGKVIGKVSP